MDIGQLFVALLLVGLLLLRIDTLITLREFLNFLNPMNPKVKKITSIFKLV